MQVLWPVFALIIAVGLVQFFRGKNKIERVEQDPYQGMTIAEKEQWIRDQTIKELVALGKEIDLRIEKLNAKSRIED